MELQIAENIKKMRKEHSWTQEQLAEALNVTVGAVYKWESKQSMPEIKLLVEMAELFETSVDVILGYSWESRNMGQTAEEIRGYQRGIDVEECCRLAERSLKKYPNSFEIVFQSAEAYFHTMNPKYAPRAIELYQESIRLIDQNTYEHVSLEMIDNRIATCYCFLDKVDEAIALFKKNNTDHRNDSKIGLILSQCEGREEESLVYLSKALCSLHGILQSICVGYTHAYRALGKLEQLKELIKVLYDFGEGLLEPDTISYTDRVYVKLLVMIAAGYLEQGKANATREYLEQAKKIAERFDASPNYKAGEGKFYHNIESARAYDDTGETAMDIIINCIHKEKDGKVLESIWEDLCNENK